MRSPSIWSHLLTRMDCPIKSKEANSWMTDAILLIGLCTCHPTSSKRVISHHCLCNRRTKCCAIRLDHWFTGKDTSSWYGFLVFGTTSMFSFYWKVMTRRKPFNLVFSVQAQVANIITAVTSRACHCSMKT